MFKIISLIFVFIVFTNMTLCQNFEVSYYYELKKDLLDNKEKTNSLSLIYNQVMKDINNYPMVFIVSKSGYSIDFSQSLQIEPEMQKIPVPKTVALSFLGLNLLTYNVGNITYVTNDNQNITSHNLNNLGSWKISNETKNIMGYKCYKAYFNTNIPEVNRASMIIPKIAWFTNEIPLNGGPTIFGNLPGLILELETKGALFKATKIEKTKEKINEINLVNKRIMSFIESEKFYLENGKKMIEN